MNSLITLSKPIYGWIDLSIGENEFIVSYLSDILAELDYLFNLKDDMHTNRILLEGEGQGDIYLTAYTRNSGSEIVIIWQHAYTEEKPIAMQFPYWEFMEAYSEQKSKITEEEYESGFMMDKEYPKISDVDNFIYDYKILLKKYPDVDFSINEKVEYDYEENPYISGYELEVVNYKTGEHRYIDGDV